MGSSFRGPWPEPGFERSQHVTTYESGVVVYNYSCHWPEAVVRPVEQDEFLGGYGHYVLIPGVSPNDSYWVAYMATVHYPGCP